MWTLASILSPKGRIDRRGFWVTWPLMAAPWVLVFLDPPFGLIAVIVGLYPTICAFSKRLHDFGGKGLWLAPVWAIVFGLTADGAGKYLFSRTLASLSGWPGGRGLFDFGDMGGLYQISGATLIFLLASTVVGAVAGRDASTSQEATAEVFD